MGWSLDSKPLIFVFIAARSSFSLKKEKRACCLWYLPPLGTDAAGRGYGGYQREANGYLKRGEWAHVTLGDARLLYWATTSLESTTVHCDRENIKFMWISYFGNPRASLAVARRNHPDSRAPTKVWPAVGPARIPTWSSKMTIANDVRMITPTLDDRKP